MLVLEPPEELGGGVSLLGRGVAVIAKDLVDERGERPEHGGRGRHGAGVGLGLGGSQRLADLAARDVEGAGDLPDGHAIAVRRAIFGVVVHRTHVLTSVRAGDPEGNPAYGGGGYGGPELLDHRGLRWARIA